MIAFTRLPLSGLDSGCQICDPSVTGVDDTFHPMLCTSCIKAIPGDTPCALLLDLLRERRVKAGLPL